MKWTKIEERSLYFIPLAFICIIFPRINKTEKKEIKSTWRGNYKFCVDFKNNFIICIIHALSCFFSFHFFPIWQKSRIIALRLRCFGSSANSIKFEFEENFCLHHLSVFHRRLNSKNVHNDRFFYARVNSQAIVFKGISLINIFSNFSQ